MRPPATDVNNEVNSVDTSAHGLYLPIMAKNIHAACKVDEETRDRLDALLPFLSTEYHQATRSDALRAVVLKGLPVLEAIYATALPVSVTLESRKGASK